CQLSSESRTTEGRRVRCARVSLASSGDDARLYSVTLVNRHRATIAGKQFGAVTCGGCRNERVICRPASDVVVGQSEDEVFVGASGQPKKWLRKARSEELAHNYARAPMGSGKARQHGVSLESAV